MSAAQCSYIRPGGQRCRRYVKDGLACCPVHQPQPDLISLGASDLANASAIHPLARLASLRDAFDVLRESIQAVRLGKITPGQAWAMALLLDRWAKTREALRHQDRRQDSHCRRFGKPPDITHAEYATYEDFPPPPPVITQQAAVNAAVLLNPPDLYDPDTGRRMAAPGVPLVPTIEELAFAANERAATLYPGVIPRPFIPTGDPMPYEALQLYRQAFSRPDSAGAGLPRTDFPASSSPGLQPGALAPLRDAAPPSATATSPSGASADSIPDDCDEDDGRLPDIPKATPAEARAVIRHINENAAALGAARRSSVPVTSSSPSARAAPPANSAGHILVDTVNRVAHRAAAQLLERITQGLPRRSGHNGHSRRRGANGRPNGSGKPARPP